MKDIIEWSKGFDVNQRPWLVLGKGPSFSRVSEVDLGSYLVCSLNHVVRELPVTLAHIIDIDVAADCQEAIDRNARYLAMPYRPHEKGDPCHKTLADYARELPVLAKLEREGRLLWYNLSSGRPFGSSPVIQARFFSAEAALNVLAACGARTVRSLGVDGGNRYSPSFDDLREKTLLISGHQTFDLQFEGIARTIRESGMFYAPLFVDAPVKVFVGTDDSQRLACKVLEYSIKKHATISATVEPIDDRDIPVPGDPKNRARTGFSFSRFHIPALCGRRGRAIYMDADMLVFADIAKLWTIPFGGAELLYSVPPARLSRRPQYSVMLLDCGRLDWDVRAIIRGLDEGAYTYEQLMFDLSVVPEGRRSAAIPFEWNSLEHYEAGRTCLLHYTDMPSQPWVSNANPNRELWYSCLREAVEEGFISLEFFHGEVAKGHVSPDLPRWAGLPDASGLRSLRGAWRPPYKRLRDAGRSFMPPFLRRIVERLRRWSARVRS